MGLINRLNNHHLTTLKLVGYVLVMEQAVGKCGGSEARTEMFRVTHQDKAGNVVFSGSINDGKLEYKFHNETTSEEFKKLGFEKYFNL